MCNDVTSLIPRPHGNEAMMQLFSAIFVSKAEWERGYRHGWRLGTREPRNEASRVELAMNKRA